MTSEGPWSAVLVRVLTGLRAEAATAIQPGQLRAAARAIGIHRHTLEVWLAGKDTVSVWTLCQIAAWLVRQRGERVRTGEGDPEESMS